MAEDLNYDYNYNIFLVKSMLGNLTSFDDRQKVIRWMQKLATSNRSIEEMKLRNYFMYFLVSNVQCGQLKPPFNEYPPLEPVPDIHNQYNACCWTKDVWSRTNGPMGPGISNSRVSVILYRNP